jgi:hypothetical protein
MAKLVCASSFLILCGYSLYNPKADITDASIRLALALAFASALVLVVLKELEECLR